MPELHGYLKAILGNLTKIRNQSGLSEKDLEERLILGPGWVNRFESGETVPSVDMLLAILHETGGNIEDLLKDLPEPDAAVVDRSIYAERKDNGIIVHFKYSSFDAQYKLPNSTIEDFEAVIKVLRDGLAKLVLARDDGQTEAIKTSAVTNCFFEAISRWPSANPSDIWWFIVYRAYCDPYNHPARYARLDFVQSWKRTGGWALEEIIVRHYGAFLKKNGINIFIADSSTKQAIVESLDIEDRVEADKIDIVLTGETNDGPRFFGVVHVKASFAERRTDDVPLSIALGRAGYTSPLWTMDCKSMPGPRPVNRGELGSAEGRRSAKRKDIEDEGYFTGCFSYNRLTQPSLEGVMPERQIQVCNFSNPDDAFSKFLIERWTDFQRAWTAEIR